MGIERASDIQLPTLLGLTSYSAATLIDDKEMNVKEKRGKNEDGRRKEEKGLMSFYVESTWRSILAYSVDEHII